jgi:Radial spokehead-like protein
LKKNARQLRLWGKIIGSEKDYYIVEGQADGGEEPG